MKATSRPDPPQTAEQTARQAPWRDRVGWKDVLLAFAVWLALQVFGGIVVVGLLFGYDPSTSATGALLSAAVAAVAALGVAAVVALRPRLTFSAVGFLRVPGRWISVGLGFAFLAYVITQVVSRAYVLLTGDTASPQPWFIHTAEGTTAQFVLLLLFIGLIPVGEELLFRGFLYTWLRRWGAWVAIFGSAFVFSLFHGALELFQGPNVGALLLSTFVLGVLVSLLYERSGSLVPGIIAHSTYNVLLLVIVRLLLDAHVL